MPRKEDVSLIIPIYATKPIHLDYLVECLRSVDGQAGETIVWSDGSNDDLAHQFRQIEQTFRWVDFVFAGRNGKCVSRNNAVTRATREFILPHDADDLLVRDAVPILIGQWEGTPLYPDVVRLHEGGIQERWSLPEFSCDEMQLKCLTPVNVLHTKEQWDTIGGWNRDFNLYEDWEYNFRLTWQFGGKHVPIPLVLYRQHPDQHTRVAGSRARTDAWYNVKMVIRDYIRRNKMAGCCGKRRTPTTTARTAATPSASAPQVLSATQVTRTVSTSLTIDLTSLGDPGPGKVWAKYLGGQGMGPHDRRGNNSRRKYKRVSYGGTYAVSSGDAVTRAQFESGYGAGFVRLEQQEAQPPPQPHTPPPAPRQVEDSPVQERTPIHVERSPVESEAMGDYIESMASMTLRELNNLLTEIDFSAGDLQSLLEAERINKNRLGAVKLLEKALNRLTP